MAPGDVADRPETAVIENGSILIRGDRIVQVLAGPPPVSGAKDRVPLTLDVEGATVLPGFVDAHTHLLERTPVATSDSAVDVFIETTLPGILRGNLQAGVTTMVSMGDFWPRILAVQERLRKGSLTGPRLHVMGPAFEGPGGHPAETICGGDAWCRANLAVEVDDPAVAADRARAIAEKGVIGLKAVYSGAIERIPGEAAQGDMDPAVLEAISGAANDRGLRLAVHENFADRALDAIERGARVLAHTPYSEPIAGTALLDRLVGDRIPMIPTLWVAGPPLRDPASELWASRFANRKANAKALLDAGGLVVFGSDNAFIEPGAGMRLEIEALSAAGFAPADIIDTLTRNGAEFLGLEAEQGTIEVSKLADLVVVRGDPLHDISALTDVALVVVGGKVLVDRLHDQIATDVQPADLVILGGDIHTVDRKRPRAEAIAIAGSRFMAVGSNAEIEARIGPTTQVIKAGGATVVPGFIDGHTHFGLGLDLVRGVDLNGIVSRAEWLRVIAARASELPDGTWVVGGRWDNALAGEELPTRVELDAVTGGHPAALADIDGHSTWVNTRALGLSGIDASTPDPAGGRIVRDEAGEATGILLETAGRLVRRVIPEMGDFERRRALGGVLSLASSYGITGAHDMASPLSQLDDYVALLRAGDLRVRIWFGAFVSNEDVDLMRARREEIAAQVAGAAAPDAGPRLQLGYAKLVIDGVLSTRTAALLQPYADAPDELGLPRYTQEELNQLVANYNAAGFPIAIHAIGDRSVRMSLDAFAHARELGLELPLANRVEHNEVVDPADAPRYADLGVVASMNPHHCISGIDKYNTARLGPERAAWSFPWGRLRDAGATLVFGSDWTTAPLNPLDHLYAAVLREKPDGGPAGGWYPENRLTWDEALRAYTLEPARASGWDSEIGSIEPGKRADLVLFDRALPHTADHTMLRMRVVGTWVGGARVYEKCDR